MLSHAKKLSIILDRVKGDTYKTIQDRYGVNAQTVADVSKPANLMAMIESMYYDTEARLEAQAERIDACMTVIWSTLAMLVISLLFHFL